jgi:hypothetical protein
LSRVSSAPRCSRLPLHPSSARAPWISPATPSPNPSPGPLPETSSHSTIIPALNCKFRSIESRDSRSPHCVLGQTVGISALGFAFIKHQVMGKTAGESHIPMSRGIAYERLFPHRRSTSPGAQSSRSSSSHRAATWPPSFPLAGGPSTASNQVLLHINLP